MISGRKSPSRPRYKSGFCLAKENKLWMMFTYFEDIKMVNKPIKSIICFLREAVHRQATASRSGVYLLLGVLSIPEPESDQDGEGGGGPCGP